jgi:hypothetical protein
VAVEPSSIAVGAGMAFLSPAARKSPARIFSAPGMKKPIPGRPEIGAHFLSFN